MIVENKHIRLESSNYPQG